MMFEINGKYANRKGNYTVLAMDGPIMSVRYEDGTHADLKISIQERIWENILAEREIASSQSAKKARRTTAATNIGHYIKVVSIPSDGELTFPGWDERVVMSLDEKQANEIKKGDRLIYYDQESQTFFAVATVTGNAFSANPKKYTFTHDIPEAFFFQIDIDAETGILEKGVLYDDVELESCPDLKSTPIKSEMFCLISEDDFEILSEALTEVSEDEDDDLSDDEFDDDDEDE